MSCHRARSAGFILAVSVALAAGLFAVPVSAQEPESQPSVSPPPSRPSAEYLVIVNAANPESALDRKFVADALLKKNRYWRSGQAILPVDLSSDSPVRRKVSEALLNRNVPAVKSYWQQLVFSGREVPPPQLDSDERVVEYVRKHPGAIGYVSGQANVSGVKVVRLL